MRGNRVDYYKPSTISSQSVQENPEYQKILSDYFAASQELNSAISSREGTYNTLAQQISVLTGSGGRPSAGGVPLSVDAICGLSAQANYGALPLADRLGFQVNDQQIIDDINQARIGRLNNIVTSGNAQIAGITERLNTANNLLNSLPAGDPRRTSSEAFIKELQDDLKSVQEAVTEASSQVTNYKPIEAGSAEAQTHNPLS